MLSRPADECYVPQPNEGLESMLAGTDMLSGPDHSHQTSPVVVAPKAWHPGPLQ
jgi:hypothetical protein